MAVLAVAPNWADQLAAFGTLVTACGAVVAAIAAHLALGQLEETRRDHHVQVIADLGRRWDDAQLAAARKKQLEYAGVPLSEKVEQWLRHPDTDSDAMLLLLRIPNFFEDLAVMVESGKPRPPPRQQGLQDHRLLAMAVLGTVDSDHADHHGPGAYAQFEILVGHLEKLDPR